MINKRHVVVLAVVSGCKLLHRETSSDAGVVVVTSPPSSVAATEPDLGGTPSAIASEAPSAIASADTTADASVDPRVLARQQALREAAEFGMLGLLESDASPGTIGLGNVGTSGRLTFGGDGGRLHPSIRQGALTVNGRLPPEVIKRIIRQNFGRFRLCYENGLRLNPVVQGRVSTKFVIGADGSVTTAADAGSDMPDQNVVQCVIRAHGNLSFPQPEGGIVTVVSPIIFNPSS